MYQERIELIQSLDLLVFILLVYIWFLDGNTFWLAFKAAFQVQFCNPIQMYPTCSLPFFAVLVSVFDLIVLLVHVFGPPIGSYKSRSILIDFIGQVRQPTKLYVALLDLLIWFIQVVLVIVAFEHGRNEFKPDDHISPLDEWFEPEVSEGQEEGQGWDVRDEEARLFESTDECQNEDDENSQQGTKKRFRTSLTHPIAVIRLGLVYEKIRRGKFQVTDDENEEEAETLQD